MDAALAEKIKVALIGLTSGMNRADTAAMIANMEQLDRLVGENRNAMDPRLNHFLERRSYAKALEFLGGHNDVPAGNCGPSR